MTGGVASKQAFVVIPEFEVKPGRMEEFLAVARDDAEHSLADEPGCRQFDIVRLETSDNLVLFYEVYDSREAFDAHLKTSHLARFRESYPPLVVAQRQVRFAGRCYP